MNIGYYAHSHGTGHCRQADKLAQIFASAKQTLHDNFSLFTSMAAENYQFNHIADHNLIRLPTEQERNDDVLPGRAGKHWQPDCLHYSPVGNRDIQHRSQQMLTQIMARQIELMIIDLSVEVALLCRTASIPYLYMRLPGKRDDTPHLSAFQGAIGLLAAYPRALELPDTPQWVIDKTLYLGFTPQTTTQQIPTTATATTSVHDSLLKPSVINHETFMAYLRQLIGPCDIRSQNAVLQSSQIVTVIKGFGGHRNIDANLAKLRQRLPNAFIISLGPIDAEAKQYVNVATQVEDVAPFLQFSDLLVMACGLNAIGEACQFDTPLLAIPDHRPHDEQIQMAQALVACGRAISLESLDEKNRHIATTFTKPSPALLKTLQTSHSQDFMNSLAHAKAVKSWFNEWLLPQLALNPARQ